MPHVPSCYCDPGVLVVGVLFSQQQRVLVEAVIVTGQQPVRPSPHHELCGGDVVNTSV